MTGGVAGARVVEDQRLRRERLSSASLGHRLITEGGTVRMLLQGPGSSRTLLRVGDANPDWGIASGPVWSPDFEWVLSWDGSRVLLTTVDDPSTREPAPGASGGAYGYDVLTFDITERDVLDG